MIFQQIPLSIPDEQIKKLKALNKKIIEHLEEGFGLHIKILDELKAELSRIVQDQPRFVKILKKIDTSGDYFDVLLSHHDNELLYSPHPYYI